MSIWAVNLKKIQYTGIITMRKRRAKQFKLNLFLTYVAAKV